LTTELDLLAKFVQSYEKDKNAVLINTSECVLIPSFLISAIFSM